MEKIASSPASPWENIIGLIVLDLLEAAYAALGIGAEQIARHAKCLDDAANVGEHAHVDIERGFLRQQVCRNFQILRRLFFADTLNHGLAVPFEVIGERMQEIAAMAIARAFWPAAPFVSR